MSLFVDKIFAQNNIVGNIEVPFLKQSYNRIDDPSKGLGLLIGNGLRLFFVVAGLLALFNFIIAGFQYMTAAGDSKALEKAWSRIWLSLIGLVIIVSSFAFAVLFGQLIFGRWDALIQPRIYGP